MNPNYSIPPVPPVPPKAKKPKSPWLLGGAALLLMAFGFGIGQTAAADEQAEAVAEPETITETVTETETVEVTNPACVDALDSGDKLTDLLLDALDISSDALGNAAAFDWDALDENTAELGELTPQVADARADYDSSSLECRLGAE